MLSPRARHVWLVEIGNYRPGWKEEMILRWHMPFYKEVFAISDFLQDPVLTFGYQGIERNGPAGPSPFVPQLRRFLKSKHKLRRLTQHTRSMLRWYPPVLDDFQCGSLADLLASKGHPAITLDHFDDRADLRYDMNKPVPLFEHKKYGTLIDIGCLEHLFDTAACLENCIRMVRPGGYYLLHAPVNGYFGHGLHVFNPQGLIDCFKSNGFRIVYLKYSTHKGKQVSDPAKARTCLLWIVGRKEEEVPTFACPQQTIWATDYYRTATDSVPSAAA